MMRGFSEGRVLGTAIACVILLIVCFTFGCILSKGGSCLYGLFRVDCRWFIQAVVLPMVHIHGGKLFE